MKIRTWHEYPPIPDRSHDYGAVDDDTYEGGCPIGWGYCEEAAVNDLLTQLESDVVWTQHRYLSCSQWGWFDVTDLPWCCQIEHTDTIWGYYPPGEYDDTE